MGDANLLASVPIVMNRHCPFRGETPYKSVNDDIRRDLDDATPVKLQSTPKSLATFDHRQEALLSLVHTLFPIRSQKMNTKPNSRI